ncbi:unnamed protein product [Gordionus sp. m RMFG-2023]
MNIIRLSKKDWEAYFNQHIFPQLLEYASRQFPSDTFQRDALVQHLQVQYMSKFGQPYNANIGHHQPSNTLNFNTNHINNYEMSSSQPQQGMADEFKNNIPEMYQPNLLSSSFVDTKEGTSARNEYWEKDTLKNDNYFNPSSNPEYYKSKSYAGQGDSSKSFFESNIGNGVQDTSYLNHMDGNSSDTVIEEGDIVETIEDIETYEAAGEDIMPASMWVRKDLKQFKQDVRQHHKECMIKVGHGETVTVRVPTHENGNSLFWEFATDGYDIGFGVFFEWCKPYTNKISVYISESSSEEEEGDEIEEENQEELAEIIHGSSKEPNARGSSLKTDLETGNPNPSSQSRISSLPSETPHTSLQQTTSSSLENGQEETRHSHESSPADIREGAGDERPKAFIDEIIPLERRDSHLQIYAGSHPYPGSGVYLLKFDNSYSLWRSKALYYKIYYTK